MVLQFLCFYVHFQESHSIIWIILTGYGLQLKTKRQQTHWKVLQRKYAEEECAVYSASAAHTKLKQLIPSISQGRAFKLVVPRWVVYMSLKSCALLQNGTQLGRGWKLPLLLLVLPAMGSISTQTIMFTKPWLIEIIRILFSHESSLKQKVNKKKDCLCETSVHSSIFQYN